MKTQLPGAAPATLAASMEEEKCRSLNYQLNLNSMAKKNIYPSLIVLNRGLTLVDTGYKNYLKLIEKEIVKNSYDMKDLKKCKHYTIR